MPSFNNNYLKFAGFGLVIIIVLWGAANLMTSSVGLDGESLTIPPYAGAPSFDESFSASKVAHEESDSAYYPEPSLSGYTSGLESYETTSYQFSGRTKSFDQACGAMISLKSDSQIHFKSLNQSTNNCNAIFYAEENKVDDVLQSFATFKDIEMNRNTSSVTRHKQQLESRTAILKQQLARVEKTLAGAEAQLDRLNSRFRTTDEVATLSAEVTRSLQFINQMTSQKISLISQLDNAYQQAADLEERIDVVEFSVNLQRSNPVYPGQDDRRWEMAWEELKDTFTETMIGLTTVFGIFLLWALRMIVYLLVVIVILRGLWKFGELIWNKW